MKRTMLLTALLLAMANAHANGPPGPPVPSPDTCSAQGGVVGANLIDGTFGTGSGTYGEAAPAPGLGTQTTYLYAPWVSYRPDDGEYVIVNATGPDSPWSTWHSQLLGHTTGLDDDRFAVFNASIEPGTFYSQTLTVAPNTNFEVSFWVMNVNSNVNDLLLPNLATVIRRVGVDPPGGGVVVATTGDIPEANPPFWHQYAAVFNSASATQIELRLDNNSSGGLGNDFALDDIALAPCTLAAGEIAGTLYYDANLDGALQAGEPGLPANIPVQIVDTRGTPDTGDDVIVGTTQTDASGHYAFANIPAGADYVVHAVTTDPNVPAAVALHTPNDVAVTVTSGKPGGGRLRLRQRRRADRQAGPGQRRRRTADHLHADHHQPRPDRRRRRQLGRPGAGGDHRRQRLLRQRSRRRRVRPGAGERQRRLRHPAHAAGRRQRAHHHRGHHARRGGDPVQHRHRHAGVRHPRSGRGQQRQHHQHEHPGLAAELRGGVTRRPVARTVRGARNGNFLERHQRPGHRPSPPSSKPSANRQSVSTGGVTLRWTGTSVSGCPPMSLLATHTSAL